MGNVLLVQNTHAEGSGYLRELLEDDGFVINTIHAKHEKIPECSHELVVILGAPESANDQMAHLQAEQKLIRESTDRGIPVLGICLGSQLIAKAFGADVYPGARKEIGFYDDLGVDAGSRLFAGFKSPFTSFHWHGDTFDLPVGATRLAHSKLYQNQAFQMGSAVGLQFHLEVNEEMINLWLDNTWEMLEEIPYIDPQKIRSEIAKKTPIINHNMKLFYNNFKSMFL